MYYESMGMNRTDLGLPRLVAFEAVLRNRSFVRAAIELNVTPTAISKIIKQLEAQLDVRLFNRTTRSVALTEAGSQLFDSVTPALGQIRESMVLIGADRATPRGALRV